MKLDIVIPIKTSLLPLAIDQTIPSILSKLSYNNVYLVTENNNFSILRHTFGNKINCIDENRIYDGLSLDQIKKYFQKRDVDEKRAGWYFQQFLKLGVSKLDFISELYLIWDADAVVLKSIDFFSENGKVYFDRTDEFHKPYFEIIEKLVGIKKQVDHSFISEHLVFNKKIVTSILNKISKEKKQDWWLEILDKIDIIDLPKSGFSEYELYGNYVAKYYPDDFQVRKLDKIRNGAAYLGMRPNSLILFLFSKVFDYMSFEQWHEMYKPLPYRFYKIIKILCVKATKKILNRLFIQ